MRQEGDRSAQPPIRLIHLDAIRGYAITTVVLHHLYLRIFDPAGTGAMRHGLPTMDSIGRLAVAVFIVLSGYSLMIPVARSGDGKIPGGNARFFRRRAKRILPPYYIALALALLPLLPGLIGWPRMPWRSTPIVRPEVTVGSVAAHLLLIQNFTPVWARQINGPLWTLATEWQNYFVFPLVLLPIWRRVGGVATVTVATAFGLALGSLRWLPLTQAAPWYLGLFAMGMTAAAANFGNRGDKPSPPKDAARALLILLPAAGAVAAVFWFPQDTRPYDCLCGIAVAAMLAHLGKQPTAIASLRSTWAVRVGTVSYSLYLIHQPLVTLADTFVSEIFHLRGWSRACGVVALSLPTIAAATAAFHLLVERRFMSGRPRTERQAAVSVALMPAI